MSTDTLTRAPQLGRIVRHSGVAGQLAYSVPVSYAGELAHVVTFTESAIGIIEIAVNGRRSLTTGWANFGEFDPEWVRNFFA